MPPILSLCSQTVWKGRSGSQMNRPKKPKLCIAQRMIIPIVTRVAYSLKRCQSDNPKRCFRVCSRYICGSGSVRRRMNADYGRENAPTTEHAHASHHERRRPRHERRRQHTKGSADAYKGKASCTVSAGRASATRAMPIPRSPRSDTGGGFGR